MITLRSLRNRIYHSLLDDGWAPYWTKDFLDKKDSRILIKKLLQSIANNHSKREVMKFIKRFKVKKRNRRKK